MLRSLVINRHCKPHQTSHLNQMFTQLSVLNLGFMIYGGRIFRNTQISINRIYRQQKYSLLFCYIHSRNLIQVCKLDVVMFSVL